MARTTKKKKGLTQKQALFVKEYIVDFNASRSALAAKYSKKTAPFIGAENLKKPQIQAAIQKEIEKRADRIEITQDRVLEEYAKLAFLDPRKFYDEEGELIPVHKLPPEVAATLTGIDVQTTFTKDGGLMGDLKKIKFSDKKPALDSVAKHLGMFIERVQHGIDESTLNLILASGPPEWAESVKKALLSQISKKTER